MATTKKRQRNVSLMLCNNCASPYITATMRSDGRGRIINTQPLQVVLLSSPFILSPPTSGMLAPSAPLPTSTTNVQHEIEIKCEACKYERKITAQDNLETTFKAIIGNKCVKVKSPQRTQLQWKGFSFTPQKFSKTQTILTACEDKAGLHLRFKGESSLKIVYGVIRDKWFDATICFQKFWSNGYSRTNFNEIFIFCQRPKIIGDITLL
jgi:hypothetical protein